MNGKTLSIKYSQNGNLLSKTRRKIPVSEFMLISAKEYGKMGTLIHGGDFYGVENKLFEPALQLEG